MARPGTDWFNSPDWSPAAQAHFEEKLGRARDKGEYLRTKGAALVKAGDRKRRDAGRELLLRLVRDYPDTLTVSWAHEFLGDAYAEDEMYADAERHYREALAAYRRNPGVRGRAEVGLAELISITRQGEKYEEADALLDGFDPFFKVDYFRIHTVSARLAEERGDHEGAAKHAEAALRLAMDDEPQLPRHPDVGNVSAPRSTLRELRKLAGC